MKPLRPYQERAIADVQGAWETARSVCLVAPTGAGKTRMGEELVSDPAARVVWVAHRRELIQQAADRLRERFGTSAVGVIMPGKYESPTARIQVATIQTLLARSKRPPATHLVLDEAHHYVATEWTQIAEGYQRAKVVGLTATPERGDGEPLGDVFERLVVAASYSELVADKFLVPARVHRPKVSLGSDLAQDPLAAWLKCAEGSRTFVFCARVAIATDLAQRFRDAGVPAATVEANTPKAERDDILKRFRRGTLRVLTNVNALTEGVDVPEARTVVLARAFGHVGGYLQAVGRVLRAAEGKPDAILVDLTGCSIAHGLPTADRTYSLRGRAISGGVEVGGSARAPFAQTVKGLELEMVARGALVDMDAPVLVAARPVDEAARRAEYVRLLSVAKKHRIRDGFAAAQFHEKFGEWPKAEWA